MQLSLDGFNSTGPNDEQKWVTWAFSEIKDDVLGLAASCDTEIIGRKLAMDYVPFWKEELENPGSPMLEAAKIKSTQRQIVFSKSLTYSPWDGVQLASGDLREEIQSLKKQTGRDIIVYGGSSFVNALVREDLIDEFHLFINPIALGSGVPLFGNLNQWKPLSLVDSKTYPCGIILLRYKRY